MKIFSAKVDTPDNYIRMIEANAAFIEIKGRSKVADPKVGDRVEGMNGDMFQFVMVTNLKNGAFKGTVRNDSGI